MTDDFVILKCRVLPLGAGWKPGEAICIDTGRRGIAYVSPDLIVKPDAMPSDARPIPRYEEWSIDSTGTVWRVAPNGRVNDKLPRRVSVLWMGSNGKKSPAVALGGASKTIRSIMRRVWPEIAYVKPEKSK